MAEQTFKVTKIQNLLDICLQVYGSTQQLFKLAKDNNLSIDSNVVIGQQLTYDDSLGDSLILERISTNQLNMINPSENANINIEYWTDGVSNIYTDGIGTPYVANL